MIAFARLKYASKEDIESYLFEHKSIESLGEASQHEIESVVVEAVSVELADARNGFLAQISEAITGRRHKVTGSNEVFFPCHCCGAASLGERSTSFETASYDICSCCGWEDVGPVDEKKKLSINRGSMADYRQWLKNAKDTRAFCRWSFPNGKLFDTVDE